MGLMVPTPLRVKLNSSLIHKKSVYVPDNLEKGPKSQSPGFAQAKVGSLFPQA
jgi:hypothetical protein